MLTNELVSQLLQVISLNSPRVFGGPGGNLEKGYALCVGRRCFTPVGQIVQAMRDVIGDIVADEVAMRIKQVLEAFLDAGMSGISTGGETHQGVLDFFQFCAEIGRDPSKLRDVTISLGYGGSDKPASLRFPVYAVQALELKGRLNSIGGIHE